MNSARLWIITGASGFLGRALVTRLRDAGERVRAVTRETSDTSWMDGLAVEHAIADLADPAALAAAFTRTADTDTVYVVHSAGRISIDSLPDPATWATNVDGTTNVIDACRAAHVDRLIYVSSVHAIPEPAPDARDRTLREISVFNPDDCRGDYSKSKAEASRRVLAADDLDRVIVHPSGILGVGATGYLGTLVEQLARGALPAITRGGFDFVDVDDVADGIIAAAERGRSGECYLLTGEYLRIADLGRIVAKRAGVRVPPTVPLWLATLAAPISERIDLLRGGTPLFTPYSISTLGTNIRYDHGKASRELGYAPRRIALTLEDMADAITAADAR